MVNIGTLLFFVWYQGDDLKLFKGRLNNLEQSFLVKFDCQQMIDTNYHITYKYL